MAEMSGFEQALSYLHDGRYGAARNERAAEYSCHALRMIDNQRESAGPYVYDPVEDRYLGELEGYACSWFANRQERNGGGLKEYYDTYVPYEVRAKDSVRAKARRERRKMQYNRALWITLLDLLYSTGEKPE